MQNVISIITSTLNVCELLQVTARSLQQQIYRNFEWIIVDCASTDGTVEAALKFGDLVSVFISEPDNGIYDAWNKALPLVTGDWVLFLGAGDELYDRETLLNVSLMLCNIGDRRTLVYGDVVYVDRNTRQETSLIATDWGGLDSRWAGGRPSLPAHPGIFHRYSLFASGFRFDTRCKISADTELVLRECMRNNHEKIHINVSKFLRGGVSDNKNNRFRMIAEILYINWKVGIFFHKPFYEIAVLASNFIKHVCRAIRS